MGRTSCSRFTRMTGEVIRAMRECPSRHRGVHGMAAGAGAVIALAADFRVCTPAARFAFLFTKVGLSGGDMGAAYLLPRLVGLGPRHPAAHARRHDRRREGRTDRAGQRAGRGGRARRRGRRASPGGWPTGPAQAYAQTKALLTREQDMSLSAALELEAMTQALLDEGRGLRRVPRRLHRGAGEPSWQGRYGGGLSGRRRRVLGGSADMWSGPAPSRRSSSRADGDGALDLRTRPCRCAARGILAE